jgi:hypothetical protein
MLFVGRLFLFAALLSFLFLIIGLIKPWVVVWWEDVQNRRKVIRIYGLIGIGCALVYTIITLL